MIKLILDPDLVLETQTCETATRWVAIVTWFLIVRRKDYCSRQTLLDTYVQYWVSSYTCILSVNCVVSVIGVISKLNTEDIVLQSCKIFIQIVPIIILSTTGLKILIIAPRLPYIPEFKVHRFISRTAVLRGEDCFCPYIKRTWILSAPWRKRTFILLTL